MKCTRQSLLIPKNKNFKKMKKTLKKSSFYTSASKIMIIYYTVPDI